MESNDQQPDFASVKTRLAEIADAVDDEALSLDDALDLYEEAVALGLKASDLLETGVVIPDPEDPAGTDAGAPVGAGYCPPGSPQANETPATTEPVAN